MAFDLSTAQPIQESTKTVGFDISTAKPVQSVPIESSEDKGFLERVGERFSERKKQGYEIAQAVERGDQSVLEGAFQTGGKVLAGGVLDVIGEGVSSVGRGIVSITPEPVKEAVKGAGRAFMETEVGQLAKEGIQKGVGTYQEFAGEHPRAARNIEAATNMAILLTPPKPKSSQSQQTIAGKAAGTLETAAQDQIIKRKENFVKKLLTHIQTKAVKEEQVARTTETGRGLFKKSIIEPSKKEALAIDEVLKLDGIGTKETIQGNVNIIDKAIVKEAEGLKSLLKANDIPFPRREFRAQMNQAKQRLSQNPLIVGDAERTAERIVNKMEQIMSGKKSTASNLLEARKELDAWMKSQKGAKIFDPKQEGAISIALREIRQTTNDFIDSKAKNVPVKESLKKQSNLYNAIEIATPKAAEEFDTALKRGWHNAVQVITLRGRFTDTAATVVGVGGLGAAAMFAPAYTGLLAVAGAGYVGAKFVTSPIAKRATAQTLKLMDKAIRFTKDKQVIEQLRADRAAILEISKEASSSDDIREQMGQIRNSKMPENQKQGQLNSLREQLSQYQ